MVNVVGNILSPSLLNQLTVLKKTAETIDEIQLRLATGKSINSAIDDPINFFASQRLNNTAGDYERVLDGIGQSRRVLEVASTGLEATDRLINQAENVVQTSKEYLEAGEIDPAVYEVGSDTSPDPISTQILASVPDVYYRLNETAGPIVDYGSGGAGPVAAVYAGGASPNAPPLYDNGSAPSVQFDGANDRIRVSDSTMINTQPTAARTVELVFNADDVAARQVLYEEGATVNGLTIYVDGGNIYFTAEDDNGGNRFFDIDINAPIVAGQTYHAAFVFDGASNSFSGYLDGVLVASVGLAGDATFPSHSGDIGIGGVNGGVQFHDGESGVGNGFNFAGRISDVAIYNRALPDAELAGHANGLQTATSISYLNRDYENIIQQINEVAIDASYRGINVLIGEKLRTDFNPEKTSFIDIEGQDFTANGLGFRRQNFNNLDDVNDILDALGRAKQEVRTYSRSLSTSIAVIETRLQFTKEIINTNKAGADDLTVSDQNKDGAELLAQSTRLSLGVTALSLAADTEAGILSLF